MIAALSLPVFKDSPPGDGSASMPPSVLKFGHHLFSEVQIQANPDMFRCERAVGLHRAEQHQLPHLYPLFPIPPAVGLTRTEQPSCFRPGPILSP